jgi:anti-anti-sigma regulatory factor
MTTRITQIDDKYGALALLRVEGKLKLADAEVLEATFNELRKKHRGIIAIDLANTNFMDSDSASVLCRLKEQGASLLGLHYFTQRILEAAEEAGQ